MANKPYDVFMLSASTVDNIIRMEGIFPLIGGCNRIVKETYYEAGGEGNILICFSRLGGRILPMGPLGNDYFGQFLKNVYENENIDTAQLRIVKGYKTPIVSCLIDDNGVHSFISSLGCCQFADEGEILNALDMCRGMFVSGYYLSNKKHSFYDLTLKLVKHARLNEIEVFYDPGPLVGNIEPSVNDFMFRNSDVISLNDVEAATTSGFLGVEKSARAVSEKSDGLVVVKAGANGCYAILNHGEGSWYPGFNVKTVVDTSGCGDSFLSALMYAWLGKWDIRTCLIFANAAGAVKASKLGTGRNVPKLEEICKILQENGYNVPQDCIWNNRFTGLRL